MSQEHARTLVRQGVTVIPLLRNGEETAAFREAFQRAEADFPEYLRTPEAAEWPYVMGGFGAYGNPSSFHNGYVRSLRIISAHTTVPFFRHVAAELDADNPIDRPGEDAEDGNGEWFLEHLFDRMSHRKAGTSIMAETAHRDLNPQTAVATGETVAVTRRKSGQEVTVHVATFRPKARDYCFGGWLNLDNDRTQHFSCVLGSHADPIVMTRSHTESGFDTHEPLHGPVTRIDVPPGHMVIFFQRIQHIVTPGKLSADSYRQHRCYRLLQSAEARPAPLNGTQAWNACIEDMAVPRLPSGQVPPLYSSNHATFFLLKGNKNDPVEWSARKLRPEMLEIKTVRSGKNAGQQVRIAPRYLRDLRAYGLLGHYPPYDDLERQLLRPTALRSFPSLPALQEPLHAADIVSMQCWRVDTIA